MKKQNDRMNFETPSTGELKITYTTYFIGRKIKESGNFKIISVILYPVFIHTLESWLHVWKKLHPPFVVFYCHKLQDLFVYRGWDIKESCKIFWKEYFVILRLRLKKLKFVDFFCCQNIFFFTKVILNSLKIFKLK